MTPADRAELFEVYDVTRRLADGTRAGQLLEATASVVWAALDGAVSERVAELELRAIGELAEAERARAA
jgi:hypothetical protein